MLTKINNKVQECQRVKNVLPVTTVCHNPASSCAAEKIKSSGMNFFAENYKLSEQEGVSSTSTALATEL
jgi:hypothetical protein